MPAHRKYKKYRCEWQADCEWISLSVGLNTRQPAQFTMKDFLSVARGGLFWPEATLGLLFWQTSISYATDFALLLLTGLYIFPLKIGEDF